MYDKEKAIRLDRVRTIYSWSVSFSDTFPKKVLIVVMYTVLVPVMAAGVVCVWIWRAATSGVALFTTDKQAS